MFLLSLRFISVTGKSALLLLFLIQPTLCNATPSVIIVGAGAAGIAAATKLLENNFTNITILEAEERIGGRIFSVKFGDVFVDLGAQFCHGEDGNVVFEMVKNLNLLQHGDDFVYTLYSSSHEAIDQDLQKQLFKTLYDAYAGQNEGGGEISLGEYMLRSYNETILNCCIDDPKKLSLAHGMGDFMMKGILGLEGAFSLYDLSAKRDYEDFPGSFSQSWRGVGYKIILDILMHKYPNPEEQLPIDDKFLFNKEVKKIIWNTNSTKSQMAIVTCSDGTTFTADHVIFTPSLGVLKDKYETMFQPPLPEDKINAINELGIAAVFKVLVHFPNPWWPKENFTDISLLWNENDKQRLAEEFPNGPNEDGKSWLFDLIGLYVVAEHPNLLAGWFAGKFVPKIELCSDEMLTNGIMFILNKFAGHYFDISPPDKIIRNNWYANPHFRGTYSFQTVESRMRNISGEMVLSKPLLSSNGKPTLLFAGEATNPIHYSTVHGAIETGHREAQRLLDLLQNN